MTFNETRERATSMIAGMGDYADKGDRPKRQLGISRMNSNGLFISLHTRESSPFAACARHGKGWLGDGRAHFCSAVLEEVYDIHSTQF